MTDVPGSWARELPKSESIGPLAPNRTLLGFRSPWSNPVGGVAMDISGPGPGKLSQGRGVGEVVRGSCATEGVQLDRSCQPAEEKNNNTPTGGIRGGGDKMHGANEGGKMRGPCHTSFSPLHCVMVSSKHTPENCVGGANIEYDPRMLFLMDSDCVP